MQDQFRERRRQPKGLVAKLKRYWWLLALATVTAAALAFVSVRYEVGSPRTYTSSVDVRILPSRAELIFARETLGGTSTSQTTALMRTFIEVIRSDKVVEAAALRMSPTDRAAVEEARPGCSTSETINRLCDRLSVLRGAENGGEAVGASSATGVNLGRYRDAISVSNIEGSFIMRISVSLPSPQAAAELANALVDAYNARVEEADRRALGQIQSDLEARLADLQAALSELRDEEIALRESIGALSLEAEFGRLESALQEQHATLTADRLRAHSLASAIDALAVLESSPAGGPAQGVPAQPPAGEPQSSDVPLATPSVQTTRLQELRAELASLEVQVAERSRIIEQLENEIAEAARKQIALRSVMSRQTELQNTAPNILDALYSVETSYRESGAPAVTLRGATTPLVADGPTALTSALLFGAVSFVLMASLLAIPSALAFASELGRREDDEDEDPRVPAEATPEASPVVQSSFQARSRSPGYPTRRS